jgi:hypothetical protein
VRLALAAGVPQNDVLIDEARRRALVRAKPLAGASLATYRALEARIAGSEPEWTIELVPPASALAAVVPFGGNAPTEAGAAALDLVTWAALRQGRAVLLSGPADEAEAGAEGLRKAGVTVTIRPGSAPLRASWAEEG